MDTIKKAYGPYQDKKSKRYIMSILYTNGRKRTVSYPKWLVEQHLGRELDPKLETVDHIDGDFTNNSLSNLRILPIGRHVHEDTPVNVPLIVVCISCGISLIRRRRWQRRNARQGKAGPFCKSCGGRYGRDIQLKRIERLSAQEMPKRVMTTVKKDNIENIRNEALSRAG